MEINWPELRAAAVEVMRNAYAPYSRFPVGAAALVDDGRIVAGCNVENAAYGVVLCAECGVISSLHATGGGRIVALSCVGGDGQPLMPCGRCRQLLWEHGGPECLIEAVPRPLRMDELLPHAFGPADLAAAAARDVEPEKSPVPPRLLRWRGRGTAFVHPDLAGGQRVWTGYWDRSTGTDGKETGILEEAPTWPDVDDAIAWGRARTPRVILVTEDGTMRWVGEGDPPEATS
ncbi:cytidine deaminase [Actinomycetes bacterium KLBMP 9797]